MRTFICFAMAVVLLGSASSRSGEIDQARQAELQRIGDLGLSKMILSFCNKSEEPSATATHYVAEGQLRARQRCGMVSVDVLSTEAIAEFVEKVCGGVDGPECGQSAWNMFFARLTERYEFANWDQVAKRCVAYPIECKQWMHIEFWATSSHNDGVLEWSKAAFDAANAQYQAEFERAYAEEVDRRRRIGAALQAFGEAMAPPPTVNCVSNTYGSTTRTRCQ